MMKKTILLDQADAKLLCAIQSNCRLTSDELSSIANLSPTACQRRLRRLRSQGVIEAEVAILSPRAVGRPITMLVLVSLDREHTDIIDSFKRSIRGRPEIMSGYYVTGDTDFVLTVTAESMEAYEQFSRDFFYRNQFIKNFKTLVVMDRVKAGFAIPVEPTVGLSDPL